MAFYLKTIFCPIFLGADNGEFLQIESVLKENASELSCGDLVLEVQGKQMSGMTLSDAHDWLQMCVPHTSSVVSFKVILKGPGFFLEKLVFFVFFANLRAKMLTCSRVPS